MKKLLLITCISFFLVIGSNLFGQEKTRMFFLPSLSYKNTSFSGINFHDISASVRIVRFNPADRSNLLFFTAGYNPNILKTEKDNIPNLYHDISLLFVKRSGRHMFNAGFMPRTEKPLFGGSYSFTGNAFYSFNIIRRNHFSMNIGGGMLVMDLGLRTGNGTPWMIWPVPFFSFTWNYEWIRINLMPNANVVIAPNKPFSVIFNAGFNDYEASFRYRFLKTSENHDERRQSTEILSASLGYKYTADRQTISDGRRYGIEYNSVFAKIGIFRMLEISAGWAFLGKEEERIIEWDSIGNMFNSKNKNNIGSGFFAAISFRLSP